MLMYQLLFIEVTCMFPFGHTHINSLLPPFFKTLPVHFMYFKPQNSYKLCFQSENWKLPTENTLDFKL